MGRVGVDGSVESHRGSDAPLWVGYGQDGVLHVLSGKACEGVYADKTAALILRRRLGIGLLLECGKGVRLLDGACEGLCGDQQVLPFVVRQSPQAVWKQLEGAPGRNALEGFLVALQQLVQSGESVARVLQGGGIQDDGGEGVG